MRAFRFRDREIGEMDSKEDPIESFATVEAEAAYWLARWDSGTMSEDEIESLENWKREHPDHQSAFDKLQKVWAQMGIVTNIVPERYLEESDGPNPDILIRALEELDSNTAPTRTSSLDVPFYVAALLLLLFVFWQMVIS